MISVREFFHTHSAFKIIYGPGNQVCTLGHTFSEHSGMGSWSLGVGFANVCYGCMALR